MENSAAATQQGRPHKRRRMAAPSSHDEAHAQSKNQPREVANPLPGSLRDGGDSLDLSVFLDALQHEVTDLHSSMKASRDSRSEKAFQSVSRSLRRRTASHDAKRLPKRLRARARRDQAADNTPSPAVGRAKRKNARPASAWVYDNTKKRIRRQQEKKLARRVAMAQNGVQVPRTMDLIDDEEEEEEEEEDDDDDDEDEGGDAEDGHNEGLSEDTEAMNVDRAAATNGGGDVEAEDGTVPGLRASGPREPTPDLDNLRLPTHLWHAKRAHMANPGALWHTVITKSPSNKTYRQALRTAGMSQNMCLSWDTSFMAVIRLRGTEPAHVDAVLAAVVEPHLLTPAIRSGAQSVDVKLPRDFQYQVRQQPQQQQTSQCLGEMAGPGNCGALTLFFNPTADQNASSGQTSAIQAFLRVHPVIFSHVWTILVHAVQEQRLPVMVDDFRLEVGSIDVTGVSALEAILGTLYPYETKTAPMEPHAADFLQLRGMDATALALASGTMLAFHIQDPRLDEPDQSANSSSSSVHTKLADWPAHRCGRPSGLFDDAVRQRATCLQAQTTLDSRRGKLSVGSKLLANENNHPIPVILASVGASVPVAASPQSQQQYTSSPTWTLLAPRGCIDVIWRCLSRQCLRNGGQRPRFIGLDEAQQVSLERGRPFFPQDFPGTPAGWDWELQNRNRLQRAWKKKPPAKRPAWPLLDLRNGHKGEIGSGHACDWERLFGVDSLSRDLAGHQRDQIDSEEDTDTAQKEEEEEEEVQFEVLRPAKMPDLVRGMHHVTWTDVRLAVDRVRQQQQQQPPPPPSPPFVWSAAYPLLTISIQMLGRGVPTNCARIYRLPTDNSGKNKENRIEGDSESESESLRRQWCAEAADMASHGGHHHRNGSRPKRMPPGASMALRKRLLAASLLETKLPYPRDPEMQQHPHEKHLPIPDEADLIGFVTSGAHRFQTGRGFGIGHVHAQKLVEAVVAADGDKEKAAAAAARGPGGSGGPTTSGTTASHGPISTNKEARYCIVRNAGETVGWLARWTPISN